MRKYKDKNIFIKKVHLTFFYLNFNIIFKKYIENDPNLAAKIVF